MHTEIRPTSLTALLACTVMIAALAAPRWSSAAGPDYGLMDQVLLQNVRNGYVDYDGIRADPRFGQFLNQLGEKSAIPSENRADQLAFNINAYNAFAIRGILEGYSPATSVGRIRYFKTLKFRLAGEDTTLTNLEQQHIRPMSDPRIHFAIVGASISCPRLSNRAYLPETVDAQLDDAAQRFINDISRNRFDIPQKTAFLSETFESFHEDFEVAAGSLPKYLAQYVQEPATRAALIEGRLSIRYLPYDWDLNGRYSGDAGQ